MENLEKKLSQTINNIFIGHNLYLLSDYEKRSIIFDYLTNELSYDFELLDKIIDCEINKTKITRNPAQELFDVINTNKGICNSISQYYKLLLEQVGIKSHCLICDDGTEVKHQLTLVYDKDNDIFSFDDVTSVIVKRGTKEDFFDYDLDTANRLNQGNKILFNNEGFFILPESYINYLIGREDSPTPNLETLPENISSIKNQTSKKR
ncbi:MAG: hypothetical protein IJN90_04570 [Bacilli bacterium]|nr:hypothetical protein [Bacilli bacterium]